MSLNILLLLILPYAFYICGDSDVSCGGEWRSDNLTTIVNVDSDNYVEGIFHNLQLQVSISQTFYEKILREKIPKVQKDTDG